MVFKSHLSGIVCTYIAFVSLSANATLTTKATELTKKKFLSGFVAGLLALSITGSAQAALTTINGNSLLVGEASVSDLIWYTDVVSFNEKAINVKVDMIEALSVTEDVNGDGVLDVVSFRMATILDIEALMSNYPLSTDYTERRNFLSLFTLQLDASTAEYDYMATSGSIDYWMDANGDSDISQRVFSIWDQDFYDPSVQDLGNAEVFFMQQADSGLVKGLGAWAVADSTTIVLGAVPVPAAVWLFGSGLIGLIGVARRKKV